MNSISEDRFQFRYKDLFLLGLLAASFLPTIISILNFEVLDQSVLSFVYLFAVLQLLGITHVWITVAYYLDKQWLASFNSNKLVFFVIPAGILIGSITVAVQPNRAIWEIFGYGIIFANLWHHSKQNWGIMAMVGKLRGVDPLDMRFPLVWAWPFFLFSASLRLPAFTELFDKDILAAAAQISSITYFGFAMFCLVRSRLWKAGDSIAILFAVALCLWFLPMALLYGKPYNLAVWVAAHALQYYLFVMVSLGLRDRHSLSFKKTAGITGKVISVLVGVTVLAYFLGNFADKSTIPDSFGVRLVVGIIAGINISHFWLDAFIWRFADAKVRSLHGTAYSF